MEDVFQGSGQVLGGDKKPSRLVPTNLNKGSNTDPDPDRYEDVSNIPGNTFYKISLLYFSLPYDAY